MRENFLVRDGRHKKPGGTQTAVDTDLVANPSWMGKYYSVETGIVSPKTLAYTQDGKIWKVDDLARRAEVINTEFAVNAYPKHWLFKTLTQTTMYIVDGESLWKYDGNEDFTIEKVDLKDVDGKSIHPIGLIEHKDRLWVISNTDIYVSKNLFPVIFE